MDTRFPLVDAFHRKNFTQFASHLLQKIVTPAPEVVWHYTNFAGLEGILDSGQIWATQVSGVNDSLEYRFLGDLLRDRVDDELKRQAASPTAFFRTARELLANLDTSTIGHFVTCFSGHEDDLGQWRGYGGGVCGYAMGFRTDDLRKVSKWRPSAYLMPMCYSTEVHEWIIGEIFKHIGDQFDEVEQRLGEQSQEWRMQFLQAAAADIDTIVGAIKHPKFASEMEWRLVVKMIEDDRNRFIFRQKSTVLTRHLAVDLTDKPNDEPLGRAPVASIYVGPGPAQEATRISVGDLLAAKGYKDVKVEKSKIPYRVV